VEKACLPANLGNSGSINNCCSSSSGSSSSMAGKNRCLLLWQALRPCLLP
jgi:hypothetical protein